MDQGPIDMLSPLSDVAWSLLERLTVKPCSCSQAHRPWSIKRLHIWPTAILRSRGIAAAGDLAPRVSAASLPARECGCGNGAKASSC